MTVKVTITITGDRGHFEVAEESAVTNPRGVAQPLFAAIARVLSAYRAEVNEAQKEFCDAISSVALVRLVPRAGDSEATR